MPFAEMWMDLKITITGEVCQKKMLYDVAAFLVVQMVKNLPAVQRPGFDTWRGKIPWRRKQLPTPVFLPGELHGQRRLAGYSPWGCKRVEYD